jgi:SAM-dependent methyltransferase
MKPLKTVIERVVAHPRIYTAVQYLAGTALVYRRIRQALGPLHATTRVFDIGGGTGLTTRLLPSAHAYVCFDPDPEKLAGFLGNGNSQRCVLADGTRLPVRDGAADVALIIFVAHHVNDALLDRLFSEAMRALRPGGRLLLVDPLWTPERAISRLLWAYDRGSRPRTRAALLAAVERHGVVRRVEEFAFLHRYLLILAEPPRR